MEYKTLVMNKLPGELDILLSNVLMFLRDNAYDIDVGGDKTINFPSINSIPSELLELVDFDQDHAFRSYTEFKCESFRMFSFRYHNRLALTTWRSRYGLAIFCDDVILATHLKLACF